MTLREAMQKLRGVESEDSELQCAVSIVTMAVDIITSVVRTNVENIEE